MTRTSNDQPGSRSVQLVMTDMADEQLQPKGGEMTPVILVQNIGDPWRSGLFDCFQHPLNAIITTVAPCVTFGQIAEILDNGSTSCWTGASLCMLYLLVCNWWIGIRYRRRLRKAFKIAESPVTDWTAHIFFCLCALCQEFRELKYRGLDPLRGYQGLTAGILQGENLQTTENTPPAKQFMTKDNDGGLARRWQDHVDNPTLSESSPPAEVAFSTPHAHKVGQRLMSPKKPLPPLFSSSSRCSGSNCSGTEQPYNPPSSGIALAFAKSTFTYEELKLATDGFSGANLLGEGGFGLVHKGMLPDGKDIAVKQLKAGSGQGEREFQTEVETISRVHHRHLVTLIGYCVAGPQCMLVYEFVPNNTLQFHLHGKNRPAMDWPTRLKIAVGSAKGLSYLHEDCHPKIIHRDIKAANILLNFEFEAKVADFGFAKFMSDEDTHVSTRVVGTFGYIAPEYACSGKLNEKSDVYSFGVVLLELISGNRPIDRMNPEVDGSLVRWGRPRLATALNDGNFDSLADPKLQNNYDQGEMARMVACAATCVHHSEHKRPKMSQIVRALEGDMPLPCPNEEIRLGQGDLYSSYVRSDKEDLMDFENLASASQEHDESLYSRIRKIESLMNRIQH